MRTLFLVHLEEYFHSAGYISEKLISKVKRQITHADKIIAMESEIDAGYTLLEAFHEHARAKGKFIRKINWGWGYEKDMFDGEEANFLIESEGAHEYTWVPPELRELRQSELGQIIVAGGCRGECLSDFFCVMRHLNLQYNCPWDLTY